MQALGNTKGGLPFHHRHRPQRPGCPEKMGIMKADLDDAAAGLPSRALNKGAALAASCRAETRRLFLFVRARLWRAP